MRCEKVMKRDVVSVAPDASVQQAAIAMRDWNVGFLPVCDEEGHVLGTLTDRDIAVRLCADDDVASETPVATIMSPEIVDCGPGADLVAVERLMAERQKSRILVTDEEKRLLGVISLSDVAARDSNKHAAHTLRKIVAREQVE